MLRYGKCFFSCFALILLFSCSSKSINQETVIKKEKNQLRIVTYNINWGQSNWPITAPQRSADAIRLLDGDIVLLQEATSFWASYLKDQLSDLYPYQIFKPQVDGGGLAVLTKYPVSHQRYIHAAIGWHPGWIFNVKRSSETLQIANLHLTPPLINKKNLTFSLSAYFYSPEIRAREVDFYFQLIQPNIPTIIAGDFNEGDNGFVTQFLHQHGFTDVRFASGRQPGTWRWKLGFITVQQQLDHIFYDRSFAETKAQVYYAGDSDHYPLAVDLKRVS